jgi:hypothetical protein
MLTIVFIIVVGAAVVGSMWMFRNLQPQIDGVESALFSIRGLSRAKERDSAGAEFRAVSIRTCKDACEAAKALSGKRFLTHKPPFLPLADCDQSMCQCRYQHHEDRREEEDRRDEFYRNFAFSMNREHLERRERQDRRAK